MVSESKLHIIRPREKQSFRNRADSENCVDGLLVLFMPLVIRQYLPG